MKVADAYNDFISYGRAERNYAVETLTKLKDCFRAWILPYLGEKNVGSITRTDIIGLRAAMVNKGIGINRQYSVLMTLKLFFKFCREVLKLSCLDPNTEIKLPQRKRPHVQYLTNEEVGLPRPAIAQRPNSISRVLAGCSLSPNFPSRSRSCSRNRPASARCSNPSTKSSVALLQFRYKIKSLGTFPLRIVSKVSSESLIEDHLLSREKFDD